MEKIHDVGSIEDAIRSWTIEAKIELLDRIADQLYEDINADDNRELWNEFLDARLHIGYLTEYV